LVKSNNIFIFIQGRILLCSLFSHFLWRGMSPRGSDSKTRVPLKYKKR
jgi:hypothetical protein